VYEEEKELRNLEYEIKMIEIQLKEKEQEGRLNEFKIRELKRNCRHKELQPLQNY
jgi:hypothetical protein